MKQVMEFKKQKNSTILENKISSKGNRMHTERSTNISDIKIISHFDNKGKTLTTKEHTIIRNLKESKIKKDFDSKTANNSSNFYNHNLEALRNKISQQRSTSYSKYFSREKMIKLEPSYTFSSKSCFNNSSGIPKIDYGDSSTLKMYQPSNHKLGSFLNESKLTHTSIKENDKRLIDILHELKEILKKDIIRKRKLKYILKQYQIFLFTSNQKSKTKAKYSSPQNKDTCKHIDKRIDFVTLHDLAVKSCKSYQRHMKAVSKNLKVSRTTHSTNVGKSLAPQSFESKLPNYKSRTPSPALPLLRDDEVINKFANKKLYLQSKKKKNVSDELYDFNLQLCNKLKHTDSFKKYLAFENKLFSSFRSPCRSSPLRRNLILDNCKDSTSVFKNNMEVKKTFALGHFPNNLQETQVNSRCITPLNLPSSAQHCSPIFLLNNNNSSLLLNKDITIVREEQEILDSLRSSSSHISSRLESSRSRTPNLCNYQSNYINEFAARRRSISFSRTSENLSFSLPKNLSNKYRRSCSKSSSQTFISSTKHSYHSYSCSSRSSDSITRSSRPTSFESSRSRSPSIPRRHGSPSFLDRRRITSARKRPVPYHRSTPSPMLSTSSIDSSAYSDWSISSCKSSQTTSCDSSLIT